MYTSFLFATISTVLITRFACQSTDLLDYTDTTSSSLSTSQFVSTSQSSNSSSSSQNTKKTTDTTTDSTLNLDDVEKLVTYTTTQKTVFLACCGGTFVVLIALAILSGLSDTIARSRQKSKRTHA